MGEGTLEPGAGTLGLIASRRYQAIFKNMSIYEERDRGIGGTFAILGRVMFRLSKFKHHSCRIGYAQASHSQGFK